MAAGQTIEIMFQGAKMSASVVSITIGDGGTFQLTSNTALQFSGNLPLGTVSVTSGSLTFNGSAGDPIDGSITIPAEGSEAPTITVAGFTGQATLYWPSNNGTQLLTLSAGHPVTLSGFA